MSKLSSGEVRWSERAASRDRAMPSVPGINAGQLTGEMSTDHWRISDSGPMLAHSGSGNCKRFGVRPDAGRGGAELPGDAAYNDPAYVEPVPVPHGQGALTGRQIRFEISLRAFVLLQRDERTQRSGHSALHRYMLDSLKAELHDLSQHGENMVAWGRECARIAAD